MSRYHPVRGKRPPAEPQQQPPQVMPSPKYTELIEKTSLALFDERNGKDLETAIARCERLLALSDREVEKLGTEVPEKHRWLMGPSVVLRWQTLLLKLQAQRDALREECFQIACQLVERWEHEAAAANQSLWMAKEREAAQGANPQPAATSQAGAPGAAAGGAPPYETA